jgi:mRNA interferase RelE/StbE
VKYEIRLRHAAQRQLDKLTGHEYRAVAIAISSLELQPRPRGCKKLADSGLWRVRAGHYRVVYMIDDEEKCAVVLRIARRNKDAYRGL